MTEVVQHTGEVEGHLVVWRQAPGDGTPILWVHGVPDSGELWTPLLAQAGGVAPDLPGFGHSGKRADFPYSIDGYADFLDAFCRELGLDRVRLVVHDWGAVGLALAARRPERIERLVAIAPVPFVAGFRWHTLARAWRTPVLGEVTMGLVSPFVARRIARGMPRELLDRALANLDHGTQRAILRLYRSAPPGELARAGEALRGVDAPALVVWGGRDPFLPERHAHDLAALMPAAEVEIASERGHWPWVDDDPLQERILGFLAGD